VPGSAGIANAWQVYVVRSGPGADADALPLGASLIDPTVAHFALPCFKVNIELIDGFTDKNLGPLLRIRLPHLTCNSLDDVNVKRHPMFCGPNSRAMRPLFKVGQSFNVYQSDEMLDELAGRKLRLNDLQVKLLQKMSRLQRR
jgi:hypothetical protein